PSLHAVRLAYAERDALLSLLRQSPGRMPGRIHGHRSAARRNHIKEQSGHNAFLSKCQRASDYRGRGCLQIEAILAFWWHDMDMDRPRGGLRVWRIDEWN